MSRQGLVTQMNTKIRLVVLSALLIGVYSTPALAQVLYTPPAAPNYGTTYDSDSGNLYNWSRDSFGNTRLDGRNLQNGSSWETTMDAYGSMRGLDSNYNTWSYDRPSEVYEKSDPFGRSITYCRGSGLMRRCN
jgi:hypothetical protein